MKKQIVSIGLLVALLGIGACALDVPTQISAGKVEVSEGVVEQSYETIALKAGQINALANAYQSDHGQSMDITVTYDPSSKKNTAMNATLEAARLAKALGEKGVKNVSTKVMPVSDSWNTSHTFVSYSTLSAHAPSGCDQMPGFDDVDRIGNTQAHKEYRYGCTIETMIAEQIADPADLLGVDDKTSTDSGRRATNVVEGRGYYSGDQFPTLEGEGATE